MPRLSIIIPFSGDEVALETTLVSVLENRPTDCEVLVCHDGSYHDPYALGDEVLFIETAKPASEVSLLNEAMRAAVSPVLHILRCGVRVMEDWTNDPMRMIAEQNTSVVAPVYVNKQDGQEYSGLDLSQLWCRRLISADENVAAEKLGPMLAGCFIKRRVLLALDGLRADVSTAVAEAELGLALRQIGATVASSDFSTIQVPAEQIATFAAGEYQSLGHVVAQYDAILGGVGSASHFPTLVERLLGSLSLSRLAAIRSFTKGYRELGSVSGLKKRLDTAAQIIAAGHRPVLGVVDGQRSTTYSDQVRKAA
ncbi:MAG: glycosyltransferase family 2 protein [Planctomycetaceae bacterium]|nr:glycosyltransferase family 2 protein [Planctomycetaceae bacterium]MBN8603999.1 glycosyltransferase family 2 protein [Planctomycetota bacterium]